MFSLSYTPFSNTRPLLAIQQARSLKWAFTQIEVISHGVLATRMLLHLRQTADKKGPVALRNERFPSTIQFSTRPGYNQSTWTS
jgi:hypothetical protein